MIQHGMAHYKAAEVADEIDTVLMGYRPGARVEVTLSVDNFGWWVDVDTYGAGYTSTLECVAGANQFAKAKHMMTEIGVNMANDQAA